MDKFLDERRRIDQCLTSLEQDARQPRLTKEANGPADTKNRERTEGVATVVQAMHGDSLSANQVDPGPKTTSTSFGVKAEPLALLCREDVLVENGAAAPKSCLSPLEILSPIAAGGLLPAGETSTATKITFDHPTFWFCLTEDTNLKTSILYVSYLSSFGWINNQQAPFRPRVIETKSGQNRISIQAVLGRLRACPFLRTWRTLLCDEVMRVGAAGGDLQCFFGWKEVRGISSFGARYKQLVRIAVDRRFSAVKLI